MAIVRGGRRALLKPLALLGVLAALLALASATASPGAIERVSVDSGGTQGNGPSGFFGPTQDVTSAISADGRFVAFESVSTNLVTSDTNGTRDVFVRDRQAGTTERVSVDSDDLQGDGDSSYPGISGGGRFVVFESDATNLVTGDTNGTRDVFVRDRQTGTTELASVNSNGVQGNNGGFGPAISDDGRFVVFSSVSTNLEPGGQTIGGLFVHDRQTGMTERVSVNTAGLQANAGGIFPALSSDGRFVTFSSLATDLVTGDNNGKADVFVRDRQTGTTERVSVSSAGGEGNDESGTFGLDISGDGRFVAFSSSASNLVDPDANLSFDIFVRDRQTGTTTVVSVNSAGVQGVGQSNNPTISDNGRFVAFDSAVSNLVAGDSNSAEDIFVHNRLTGTTERVSVSSGGAEGNGLSFFPHISGDGRLVAFASRASNLVDGDTNEAADVFVVELIINVTIDIKPGSDPNSIKLGDTGSVPVAILSTETFDATTIDVSTLLFDSTSVRLVGGRNLLASIEDINSDGLADLVVKFDRGTLNLAVGDGIGTVTGSTLDGQRIRGTDSVRVIE